MEKIFDFNHIDPKIEPKELEEIKKLYKTYHRLWWCFKKLCEREKKLDLAEKISSTALIATGLIAGEATLNPIVLGTISGVGLILKTIQEARNRAKKIEKARFAFTTYEKTLSDLRSALRGGTFDRLKFNTEMNAIDSIVIDFGLNQEQFELEWREQFLTV